MFADGLSAPNGIAIDGTNVYIANRGDGAGGYYYLRDSEQIAPALALEEFTAKEELLPTIESVLRVFEQTGNRDNKLRARLKWVVDQLGFMERLFEHLGCACVVSALEPMDALGAELLDRGRGGHRFGPRTTQQ